MIPPDIAIRLRMQTEAALSPIASVHEVSSDLANLQTGQTFQARIEQPLPDNTFRALVGGKEITLALPESVKTGDLLELVVVDRTARMIVAQRAPQPLAPVSTNEAEAAPTLSSTAQMIAKLLPPQGQSAPPAVLNGGQPLVATLPPTPRDMAAVLLPRLAQATTQSGLFYEAHQAQWIAGKHSTEALLQEPQARAKPALTSMQSPSATETPSGIAASGAVDVDKPVAAPNLASSVPDDLRPLVQQQLDAAATQRVVWQGDVWPGQHMEWQIARDLPERGAARPQATERWNTSLALTTPALGRVEANLGIVGNRVTIRIDAASAESGARLRQHLPALTAALNANGIGITALEVRNGGE